MSRRRASLRVVASRRRSWKQCAVFRCRRRSRHASSAWSASPSQTTSAGEGLCDECHELVPEEYQDAPPEVQAAEVQLRRRYLQLREAWERTTGEPMRIVSDTDDEAE